MTTEGQPKEDQQAYNNSCTPLPAASLKTALASKTIRKRHKPKPTYVFGGLSSLPRNSVATFMVPDLEGNNERIRMHRCMVKGCNFVHRRSTDMVVHVRKHYAIKAYSCSMCDQTFT